jgi:HK97 family phage major capsid protein
MRSSAVPKQPARYLGATPHNILVADSTQQFEANLARLEQSRPYSLSKTIRQSTFRPWRLDGLEYEVHQELSSLCPHNGASNMGVRIPQSALAGRRDLTAIGSALVETRVEPPVIPFLRNKAVCGRAGATILDGLTGANLQFPRQTGTGGATWLAEIGAATNAEASFDQFTVSPKRCVGFSVISKQLVTQSVPDIDEFIGDELSAAIAIAVDSAALYGTGSPMPVGVFGLPVNPASTYAYNARCPDITFGGPASRTSLLNFEHELELSKNHNDGSFAFVTSPATHNKLAATPVVATFPRYLWEQEPDELDGTVIGRRAISSAQITDDKVIFGKWSELLICTWLGVELLTNPVSRAKQAEVEIYATLFCDIAFKHASAFCASTDSGAQ